MLGLLRFLTGFPWVLATLVGLFLVVAFLIPSFAWYIRTPLVILLTLAALIVLYVVRAGLEGRSALDQIIANAQAEHEREQATKRGG